ncbi:Mbov_0399 family ICE element protein [Mycoplasma sp. 3686d]|uniref:Mbov_0399 family ICE element protein n=1 Tax=Mycoplasma sp. 3686d TaxID=2967300 RepID=UPI00211BF178|nr:hypothetical protein [Mycoplasma sp. 3686d]UUM24653.1 hypothetical protein NPA12_03075 [Mycoplasma sp. 3686d]
MRKTKRLILSSLVVAPTTIFSILGVSAISNDSDYTNIPQTSFDEIINRQNTPIEEDDIFNETINIYKDKDKNNNHRWNWLTQEVNPSEKAQWFFSSNLSFDKNSKQNNFAFHADNWHNKNDVSIPKNIIPRYDSNFYDYKEYKNINEITFNFNNMDPNEFLDKLKQAKLNLTLGAIFPFDNKSRGFDDFLDNLKWKINQLNNYQNKQENTNNSISIKSITVSLNANVLYANNSKTTVFAGGGYYTDVNSTDNQMFLDKLDVNVQVRLHRTRRFNKDNNFYNGLLELKNEWENSKLKSLNSINLSTDVGSSYGVSGEKIASDDKSNQEYLEEELKKYPLYNKRHIIFTGQWRDDWLGTLNYRLLDNGKLQFYFMFYNPQIYKTQKIIINKGVDINWKNTDKFKNKNLASHLKITPGYFLDNSSSVAFALTTDKPVQVENDSPINDTYGGTWIYHAPAKVEFETSDREDEALIINGNKIDVLNKQFAYDLNDLRGTKEVKQDDQNKSNQYTIEIVKYDKANANGNNQHEIKRYKIVLIINSLGSDITGRWYGWKPDINPHQRELIEPYLKNERGDFIVDSKNRKLKNPKYDPLINPKTGTKEEILWVNYTGNSYDYILPQNTRFLQDPLDENGKLKQRFDDGTYGFIASGSVVGKGINVSSSTKIDLAQRFKVNQQPQFKKDDKGNIIQIPQTSFSATNEGSVNIINNDNDYFSTEGLWLYTLRDKENIDSYKLFYIGNESPNAQFRNVYQNTQIQPFWNTIHGKHLQEYLVKNRLIAEDNIKKLTYEQIINYWKQYINEVFTSEEKGLNDSNWPPRRFRDRFNDPKLHTPDGKIKIAFKLNTEELKKYAMSHTPEEIKNLSKDELIKLYGLENYPNVNSILDSTNFDFRINKNEIKASIKPKNTKVYSLFDFSSNNLTIPVKWKEDVEFEAKTQKTKITPSISTDYLNSLFENATSYQYVLNNIEDDLLLDFENKDKVDYTIEKTFDNKFRFIFNVREDYYKDYYIPRDEMVLYYEQEKIDPNYKSNLINVFDNFNLKQINLNGITDLQKAKDFIKQNIEKTMGKAFVLNRDYVITNLDAVAQQAISNVSTFDNPVYFNLNLTANTDKLNQLIGFKTIKVYNSVINNTIPRESNLVNYNISNKSFSGINTIEDMYNNLVQEIDKDLAIYGINFKDYLTFENEQELYKLIVPKKINKINLKLIPVNNLLNGDKTIEITNDNTGVSSSPDVDENGKIIEKKIDYSKLAQEKEQADETYINSRNFESEKQEFKDNQIKNEWEIGFKPPVLPEGFKLPDFNAINTGISNINNNANINPAEQEQSYFKKNWTWILPTIILSSAGLFLLGWAIYTRYFNRGIK